MTDDEICIENEVNMASPWLRGRPPGALGRQRALALLADIRDAGVMGELARAGRGAARRRIALGADVLAGEALEALELARRPRAA